MKLKGLRTRAEINIDNFINNIQVIKNHVGSNVKLMAVIKADGYGHGAVRLAKEALEAGVSQFAVACVSEAIELRKNGIKAGLLKIRVYRPFPGEEMAKTLKNCKAVAIMDRCEGYNSVGGPLGAELTAAMYREKATTELVNIIYGLSGRDVRTNDVEDLFEKLEALAQGENKFGEYPYLGLRSAE